MLKSEPISIPSSALAVKAWFKAEPGDAIRKEVRDFIKTGNMPFLWRGHTHTRPERDAKFVYICEFELPETLRKGQTLLAMPGMHHGSSEVRERDRRMVPGGRGDSTNGADVLCVSESRGA
jgi:hypothetical protein